MNTLINNRKRELFSLNLKKKSVRNFIWLAFIVYLLAVCILCFAKTLPLVIPESNPVPYIYVGNAPFIYLPFVEMLHLDFYLNILMTFPFGIFIALLRTHPLSVGNVLCSGLALGSFIEITQLILDNLKLTSRWIDINDVLANAVGLCLGYWLMSWLLVKIIKYAK
ncbi:VanZ family protein [Ligilactobacillus pobuzihii]|uniref:VanZ family protein n=1 Tax=Ligilactobacillus pobuzihii TaxID=449659 RepID=UPI001F494355|nr:VanZ family protein [Ligilactobacillus pobuzihii]